MTDYGFSIKNKMQHVQVDSQFKNFYLVYSNSFTTSVDGYRDEWWGAEESAGGDVISVVARNPVILAIKPGTVTNGAVAMFPWGNDVFHWYVRFAVHSVSGSVTVPWAVFSPNWWASLPQSDYGIEVRKATGAKTFSSDRRFPMKIVKQHLVTHPYTDVNLYTDFTVESADNWFWVEPFTIWHTSFYEYGPPTWRWREYRVGLVKIDATTVRANICLYTIRASAVEPNITSYYNDPLKILEIKNELPSGITGWIL